MIYSRKAQDGLIHGDRRPGAVRPTPAHALTAEEREQILSVGFEYGGRLSQLTGQVEITLPAELLDGYALMLLNADGAETMLFYTLNGGEATFTLDFTTDARPARVLRLIPVS